MNNSEVLDSHLAGRDKRRELMKIYSEGKIGKIGNGIQCTAAGEESRGQLLLVFDSRD